MSEIKLFLFLVKSNFQKLWKLFILIILFALLANFLTILQPLIFASMMELVLPKDLSIFGNEIDSGSIDIKDQSIFDLNFIGEKILTIINAPFQIHNSAFIPYGMQSIDVVSY